MIRFNTKCELTAAAGKPVKVRGVLYAGGIMSVPGYGNIVIVIAGMEVSNPVVLLADHANEIAAIAGSVTVTKTATEITVNGTLSNSPAGTVIAGLLADGAPIQMSVGASPGKTRFAKAGEKVNANGREMVSPAGGLTVIETSRIKEATAIPLGADDATFLIAARRGRTDINMDDVFISAKGFDPATITPEQRVSLQALYDAEQAGGVAVKAAQEIRAAEVDDIIDDAIAERPGKAEEFERVRASAHLLGWDRNKVEQKVLRAGRADPRIGAAGVRACWMNGPARGGVDNRKDVLACAMARHLGFQLPDNTWTAPIVEAAHKLKPMIPAILRAAGHGNDDMIRATGFSTSDIPVTLSNIAGKSIDHAFAMFPRTSQSWIGKKMGDDFKDKTDIRPHIKDGRLEEVGAAGELKHVAPSEQTRTRRIKTRGKILTVTRQALINDDVGYWAEAIMELGRQGVRSHEHDVYAALLANTGNFFHANNSNVLTSGGTSVLSFDSLAAAVKLLRERVDGDNMPIGLIPMVLLVPPALEQSAKALINSTELSRVATGDNLGTSNPFSGIRVEIEPRLASTHIHASASSTAWYLFCDPRQAAALVVSYLDGKETATIEEVDLPAEVLGKGWRIYFDYGCDLYEPRAGIRSPGA